MELIVWDCSNCIQLEMKCTDACTSKDCGNYDTLENCDGDVDTNSNNNDNCADQENEEFE